MLSGCSKKEIGIGVAILAVIIAILIIVVITSNNSSTSTSSNTDKIVGVWNSDSDDSEYFEIYADGTGIYSHGYANHQVRSVTWFKNGNGNYYTFSTPYFHQIYDAELLVELSGDELIINYGGRELTFIRTGSNDAAKTEHNEDMATGFVTEDYFADDDSRPKCSVCGRSFDSETKEYNNTGVCEGCAEIVYN